MKFIIHCDEDSIEIEGETVEEIRTIANYETSRRGWKQADCWSERVLV